MIKTIKLFALIAILFSCGAKNKTVYLGNFSLDMPEKFQSNFLNNMTGLDNRLLKYESYGMEIREAIYGVEYSKYKPEYGDAINLENIKDGIINNLKNSGSIREYKVVSEGYVESNSYEILSGFYYGPHATYNRTFITISGDNEVLKIACMYNADSKADDRRINEIIKSVRVAEYN